MSQMQMRFDVSVTFDDGECADIECQCRQNKSKYNYRVRTEIQAARLLNNNAKKSSDWNAGKIYQITVADFEFEKDDNSPFAWYTMRSESGHKLGGRLNVIILDLVKIREFKEKEPEKLTDREKWGMYFAYAGDKEQQDFIEKIAEGEVGIMAAETVRKYMSKEESNWFAQNSYDTAVRDYNAGLETAEKIGLEKGIQQKAIETAINMLKKNYPKEDIAEITGLPVEQVQALVADNTTPSA